MNPGTRILQLQVERSFTEYANNATLVAAGTARPCSQEVYKSTQYYSVGVNGSELGVKYALKLFRVLGLNPELQL
jgi:hypothetical protein